MNFFIHLGKEILRLFVVAFNHLVSGLKFVLGVLLFGKTVFSSLILLFSSVEVLHSVFKDGVDVSNVEALGSELLGVRGKLILLSGDLRHQIFLLFLRLGLLIAVFAEHASLLNDLGVDLLVGSFCAFKNVLLALKLTLSLVVELL